MNSAPTLFPPPTSVELVTSGPGMDWSGGGGVTYPEGCTVNLPWALGKPHDQVWLWDESDPLQLSFELDSNLASDQAYRLEIRPRECVIRGGGELGFLYGAITLNQWISQHPQGMPITCVTIEDAPKIERRGYMLDVSRDRMPTMDRLHELIEQLARLKYNHLELYLEHTFEYSGHESVSDGASPITADEMRVLVGSAKWHGIEVVPNQNTFGHMHRWLTLPAYNHLAEEPGGTLHAFDFRKEPFGLCAANPESLKLVDDLVGQLWPLFDSEFFNAGLDETFDLGRGGSAELCAEKGKGMVYMDYLCAVNEMIAWRGKRMVFWADILLEHPEVFEQLPKGCVPVIWGYEQDHPLDAQAKSLSDIGAEFWIAPGTSSWQSLTGRASNCLGNIRSAARAAIEHGAGALVLTDWGDWGHWQPPSLSNLGILHFAIQSWSGPDQPDPDASAIDRVFYGSREAALSGAWMRLWNASESLDPGVLNGTSPFYAMRYPQHGLHPEGEWEKRCANWSLEASQAYDAELQGSLKVLEENPSQHRDVQELQFCVKLATWANARTRERGQSLPTDPGADEGLQAIEAELTRLWPMRSRPGGLSESLRKMRFALHPDGIRK